MINQQTTCTFFITTLENFIISFEYMKKAPIDPNKGFVQNCGIPNA